MSNFAPPLKDLAKSGIGVAAAPTGGMGLALSDDGKIPAGVLFLGTQAMRIAVGVATLTWAGGTSLASVSAPHTLGVVPAYVVATVNTSGQGEVVAAHANADATDVFIQAQWVAGFAPGAGAQIGVTWIAIR